MENNARRKREEVVNAENSTVIEVSAKNVDEAIAKGVIQLDVPREELRIEVIDEGSRGVLGLGATDARVRLTYVAPPESEEEVAEEEEIIASDEQEEIIASDEQETVSVASEPVEVEEEETEETAMDEVSEEEEIAREVLANLLQYMGIEATIQRQENLPQSLAEQKENAPIVLDVIGADLGILLGHRGETLNALQYITRLIVSHQLKRRANLIVDVESYRAKREKSLRQIAHRMAERARREGRTMRLEPMSAYERRIVHLALHDDKTVYTQSEGEGHKRRVTIVPT